MLLVTFHSIRSSVLILKTVENFQNEKIELILGLGCFCGVAEVLLAFHPEIASYQSRAA